MKKMTVGKCLSAITCILGVITFILLAVYGSKGGNRPNHCLCGAGRRNPL